MNKYGSSLDRAEDDTLLEPDHIYHLTEFLIRFAFKWRLIGTSLMFHPEDLDNIQCNNAVHVDPVKHNLMTLVTDWVHGTYRHTLAPTIGNLRKALRSEVVGLGRHADDLLAPIFLAQPHSVISISLNKTGLISESCSHSQVQVKENTPVLLKVHVISSDKLSYMWLKNDVPIDKKKDRMYRIMDKHQNFGYMDEDNHIKSQYLHIKSTNIDMDGDEFSCQIRMMAKPPLLIKTSSITLAVSCPSLDQFRGGLASIYLAQPEVPEDTWPPVSSKRYTNLAVIQQKNIKYGAKYDRYTIQGGVDDILQHKEQITYEDVFRSLKSSTTIFIEGRPGCGKTTLVNKIT